MSYDAKLIAAYGAMPARVGMSPLYSAPTPSTRATVTNALLMPVYPWLGNAKRSRIVSSGCVKAVPVMPASAPAVSRSFNPSVPDSGVSIFL